MTTVPTCRTSPGKTSPPAGRGEVHGNGTDQSAVARGGPVAPAAWASRFTLNAPLYIRLCRVGDLAVALLVLFGVFLVTNAERLPEGLTQFLEVRLSVRNVLIVIGFVLIWRLLARAAGLYQWPVIRRLAHECARVLAVCTGMGLLVHLFPLLSQSGAFGWDTALLFWVALVTGIMLLRLLCRAASATPMGRDVQDVLIIGCGPRGQQVFSELQEQRAAYRVVGFIDTDAKLAHPEVAAHLVGRLDELERVLMTRPIDEVLITLPVRSHYAEIQQAIDLCERVGVPSRHLADVFRTSRPWRQMAGAQQGYVQATPSGPQGPQRWIKRGLDIVIGTTALIALSPLMLTAAIAVRLGGPGPILFSQARYGLNRRSFRMYKFRTMVADAEEQQDALEERNEAAGPVFKIKDDPRVTRIGRLLRRSSIDELPQLWNVVRGDMSLVGPRPLPERDFRRFSEAALMRRFSVRPGLTCLWQIGGRSNVDFGRWIALDLKYIDEWSLWLDLVILARTVPVVVRGTGAV